MKIQEVMKLQRKALGITQQDLADMSEVAISTIKQIESGKGNPSLSTVEKIMDILGMEVKYEIRQTVQTRRSNFQQNIKEVNIGKNFHVQNSSSPVGCILPPHFGQVCISHLWILSEPHLRHSLPTRELKLGAASPITPPTTRGTMFLQSGQDMASICCPMKPRPSYTSVSYPQSWHLNIFFCDINNLLSYHFNTQLALDILPIYTIIDMIETAE